jgi:carboxypeptidase family protein/TonB-dependent receptor-like protein
MLSSRLGALSLTVLLVPLYHSPAHAQTQTTGGIAGIVRDQNAAVVVSAQAVAINALTGETRTATTDSSGYYAILLLPSGIYQVTISADGFEQISFNNVKVTVTETTQLNADLSVTSINETISTRAGPSLAQADGPRLGRAIGSRNVSELPLATRNFTQLLALSPGTNTSLADNTGVGRNSQNISVNGARRTQNNFQINGVDANTIGTNSALFIAVPAPETIQEFKVQTSMYDATFGRSGGGNVQAITRSGNNSFHGSAYNYFRDDVLNANNPFLKAAGVDRPLLKRYLFGVTLGGPVQKERAYFFLSYQGTREHNNASPNSISSGVLIASGLTDDRSDQFLRQTFNVSFVHPVSLALLNARFADGRFLVPSPQEGGRYSGTGRSDFEENQFNTNFDYRINNSNWLAIKFFFAEAPWTLAMFSGPNVPGFADRRQLDHRLISIQDVQMFSPNAVNETRFGYNFVRNNSFPLEPLDDSDFGIRRPNADIFPGLPLIRIAPNARGVVFGTGATNIDLNAAHHSATAADVLSLLRGNHTIRAGGEVIAYQSTIAFSFFRRGQIDFNSFTDFLAGLPAISFLGSGINDRNLRGGDYDLFIQDDWKLSRPSTLNLGLRYELNLPFHDTRGRISTFDPAVYRPRLLVNSARVPQGPPIAGFVQAENVIPQYDLPEVPNVGKRLVTSNNLNNFAPRLGFVYSPLSSHWLVVRAGWGIFYSRGSSGLLNNGIQLPPTYVVASRLLPPFVNPFFEVPSAESFPMFVPGATLSGVFLDRSIRTPYLHHYNASLQFVMSDHLLLEAAYVGTRGFRLPRLVALNQAHLASAQHPIINEVLSALNLPGAVITTNTPANAILRAPFQGVSIVNFSQSQNTAQSNYNSLQLSLTRQFADGLQFLAAYTYSRSIDNASGRDEFDFSTILGNQFDNRANRGVSDFDRQHRFVLSYLWDLPRPPFTARSSVGRWMLTNWQLAGIIVAMSGAPIDVVDTGAGSFYGLNNGVNPLARPNWAPRATQKTATSNIPAGYAFNPFAFARPIVTTGKIIPSSNGSAVANALGTDIGNVGRNVLRGASQTNVDFSIAKRFPFDESKNLEFRVEFFNLFNHVNFANPISDLNAVIPSGGAIDPNTGQILQPGDFGRITSTSNNPRLIQLVVKFNY